MNTLRALIVDDELRCCSNLNLLLKEHCPSVSIVGVARSVDEAVEKAKTSSPNVIFLDIKMPIRDGFALFDEIKDFRFDVIFTTAHDQYALKAFKLNAIDYLLKPIKPSELITAVSKCQEKLRQNLQINKLRNQINSLKGSLVVGKIPICTPTETIFVDMDDVIRLEADGNYTNIYLLNGKKILTRKTLGDYEINLPKSIFIRIHKKNLVNRYHINKLKRSKAEIILTDGSVVEVSRLKKTDIYKALVG